MTQQTSEALFQQSCCLCAAEAPWMKPGAQRLRAQVFVQGQGVFAGHDRDATDAVDLPLVAIAKDASGGPRILGTVRSHESAGRVVGVETGRGCDWSWL